MQNSERTGVIYIATINQDKSYIGMTVDFPNRKRRHLVESRKGTDSHFHRAIRKHGAESVEWRILEDDIPESRLPDREELWIAFYDTFYNGYNMTLGGETGMVAGSEAAKKMSATHKAKAARGENPMQNPDIANKVSETLKAQAKIGEHFAQQPETRAKMSATMKAKAARGEHQSQQHEVRAKLSATHKARSLRGENPMQNPEIATRVSETLKAQAMRGEHPSQQLENRKKMSASQLMNYANKRMKNWHESGQEFFLDMDLEEE